MAADRCTIPKTFDDVRVSFGRCFLAVSGRVSRLLWQLGGRMTLRTSAR